MQPETVATPAAWGGHPTRSALQRSPPAPAGWAGANTPVRTAPGGPGVDAERLSALSQAVLLLHRGCRDWPAGSFDARAIDTLAGVLPHAACLWGSVPADAPADTPPAVQGLYSSGMDAQALAAALAGSGAPPGLQASRLEPLAGRRVILQLWRHAGAAPFDEADRQALAFVLPHLVEAQRENRLDQARHGEGHARTRRSLVLCDVQGRLQQVDEHGLALLRQEWPRWLGRTLPEPLVAALQAALGHPGAARSAAGAGNAHHAHHAHYANDANDADNAAGAAQSTKAAAAAEAAPASRAARAQPAPAAAQQAAGGQPTPAFYGRSVTVLLARSGTQLLLEIRRRTAADRLSARQRDIARRYAAGHSGPQIAAQLGLSSSTVNNHLGVIFKRLGVSSKLQLSESLRADGEVLVLAE